MKILTIEHPQLKWLSMTMMMYSLFIGLTMTAIVTKGYWYALGLALVAGNVDLLETEEEQEKENLDKAGSNE